MHFQPKIEPGSPPIFDSNGHRNMNEMMSISEIVSAMHAGVDRFEGVLLARDAKHKAEIGPIQEKFELERLMRLQAEEDLKRTQESYQRLLKRVKESGLPAVNNIEEWWSKNDELKRKRMDDNNSSNNVVVELRNRVAELENENKKNLATIEKLRAKTTKVALKKKIKADDAEPLGNVSASLGGNNEGTTQAPLQRNINMERSHGASGILRESRLGKTDKLVQNNLYRLDNEGHIAGRLNVKPHRVLKPRHGSTPRPHQRMECYLRQAGFWEAANVGTFEYDSALVSALVERWRPETHTFHLPYGECTITLQDVVFHYGLRVDGGAVSGCTNGWKTHLGRDIWTMCEDLLGAVPSVDDRRCSLVNLAWFERTFPPLDNDSSDQMVLRHTRAYIMQLIGRLLMPDKSGSRVSLKWLPLLEDLGNSGNLSWGSAVLASVYRALCRAVKYNVSDIGGCMGLLLSWAYYRIPMLRPQGFLQLKFPLASRWAGLKVTTNTNSDRLVQFRALIDNINIDEFDWTPYYDPSVVAIIPEHMYQGAGVWASFTALICFEIVEWHHVDRVVRQFGGQQHIPHGPQNIDKLHGKDGRQGQVWWPSYHAKYHEFWDNRKDRIIHYLPMQDSRPSYEYFRWYSGTARRFLCVDRLLQDPHQAELSGVVPPKESPDHAA